MEHIVEAMNYFDLDHIVGIFLQGSQNYGLETEESDVDTKLIVTPYFKDIVLNRKPVSTTHVRENDEHIDFKDIRLYIQTFRKQNLNFLEILFTEYKLVHPLYLTEWQRLVKEREAIARMNPYRAVKSMKGIALEKYHALEHEYPSRIHMLQRFGYDPKQLHHLLRVEDYLRRYIAGESYESCLKPTYPEYLIEVKQGRYYSLEEARVVANRAMESITVIADNFCSHIDDVEDAKIVELLEDVGYKIMKTSVIEDFRKEG